MREHLAEINPDAIFYDGLGGALIGMDMRELRAVYSYPLILDILCNEQGMDLEEAIEYADFNIINMYVGEFTPIILDKLD